MKRLVFLFAVIIFVGLFSVTGFAQTQDRRMIFDRYDCHEPAAESKDEDSNCLVELVDVHIADQKITSSKMFVADENWLKNLKVKIKNVSGKPFVFVRVSFVLTKGLYEELAPSAPWSWGFSLIRGKFPNPDDKKRKISKEIVIKPNEEIELSFDDIPDLYKESGLTRELEKMSQIVLITAVVKFEDGKQDDSFIFIKKNSVSPIFY